MSTTDIRHLTDAELVGILDGDHSAPPGDRTDHLDTCARCADALESLRADSERVGRMLELADFEDGGRPQPITEGWSATRSEPSRGALHYASPWWKAAAILVLVAGPLAAFPSVRAWVAERVTGSSDDAPVETAAEPLDAGSTIIRFTPDPGDFVVSFEPGTAGTIAIVRGESPEAELRASAGTPETVVSASSLRIRNQNVARYELRLPAGVTGVWVRRGERAVAVSDSQIDRRAVVQLTRNGPPAEIRAADQGFW